MRLRILDVVLAGVLYACACGGEAWTTQDATTAQRDRHLAGYAYGHADGGALSADTRAIYCDQEVMLLRHHEPVDDGGTRCR